MVWIWKRKGGKSGKIGKVDGANPGKWKKPRWPKGDGNGSSALSSVRLFAQKMIDGKEGVWTQCKVVGPSAPDGNAQTSRQIKWGIGFRKTMTIPQQLIINYDAQLVGKAHGQGLGARMFKPQSANEMQTCVQCGRTWTCNKTPPERHDHCKQCSTLNAVNNPSMKDLMIENQRMMTQNQKNQDLMVQLLTQRSHSEPTDDYSKQLLHQKILGDFRGKYPETLDQLYQWIYEIQLYKTRHSGHGISPASLFEKVVHSMKSGPTSAWNQYRMTRFQQHLTDNQGKENDLETQMTFNKTVDTISELINFTIKRIAVRPDISYFEKKLSHIRCFKDESPKDTYNRCKRYLFQYEEMQKLMNPILPKKMLRSFNSLEIVALFRRVFITDNDEDSWLNRKVRTKLSAKWVELQDKHITEDHSMDGYDKMLEAVSLYIDTKLAKAVLPILEGGVSEDGKQWKKTTTKLSIFTLDSANGRKRSLSTAIGSDTKAGSESDRKRAKRQKCDLGANCPFLYSKKGCKKSHLLKDVKAAKRAGFGSDERLRNPKGATTNGGPKLKTLCKNHAEGRPCRRTPCPYWPCCRDSKVRTERRTDNRPQKRPCGRGTTCDFWQKGTCWNSHNARDMTCATCGKRNHGASTCRSKGGDYGRYDPSVNPTHKGAVKHVQFLDEKRMTALISNAVKPLNDKVMATTRSMEEMRDNIAKNALHMKSGETNSALSEGEASYRAFKRIFDPKTGKIRRHL